MADIKVGDEVRVFPLFADEAPSEGWIAYVSAVRDGEYDARPVAWLDDRPSRLTFAADDRSTDSGGQYLAVTPGWAEKRSRLNVARRVLADNCIVLESGHCLSVEQIESLAEVVKTWDQEADR
jgi:hypothetical protein